MKLLMIRHGESEADILKVHEGRADFQLTEKGKFQAMQLSQWLKENETFDLILSSPLKRAFQTAQFISDATGKCVVAMDALMEWDNGLLAGLSFEEADRVFPLPPGGRKAHHETANTESMINFRARAESFLSKLIEDYAQDAEICIVSHGGMINMLFRSLLSLPLSTEHVISCGDTSVHKFNLNGSKCQIMYINKMEHLLECI